MKTGYIIWKRTITGRLVKDRACGTHKGDGKCVKIVALNKSVGCVDGKKTGLKEIKFEDVDWTQLAQNGASNMKL